MYLKLALLFIIVLLATTAVNATQFDEKVGKLVSELGKLEEEGLNVSKALNCIALAVKEFYRGNKSRALALLNSVAQELPELEHLAKSVEARRDLVKALAVAGFAAIPIMIYIAIRFLYPYTWFRLRRDWVVEEDRQ